MTHNQIFTLCYDYGMALEAFDALYRDTQTQMVQEGALTPAEQQWLRAAYQCAHRCSWVWSAYQQCAHHSKNWHVEPSFVWMLVHDSAELSYVLRTLTTTYGIDHSAIYELVTEYEEMPDSARVPLEAVHFKILERCQSAFEAQTASQEQHP
jgi:hypothetical protein